ncbi:unnamed protein product [Amoebophrya sp. A25]|nr:unnamed protein product [Amoebophrya sp. A25]|eukprot:GSA25T00016199001.1
MQEDSKGLPRFPLPLVPEGSRRRHSHSRLQLVLTLIVAATRNVVLPVCGQPGGRRKPVVDRRQPQQLESERIRQQQAASRAAAAAAEHVGPRPLPDKLEFDTSVIQDIKRSLKVLTNDLNVIVDLLDQKLGLTPDDTEKIDETTLSRRKAEDLEKQKIQKGYVPGNICKSHVAKDIGTSIVHAGAKILLLSKRPDSTDGDRWEVNIVGTTRRVSFHELEIQCDPKPDRRADGVIDADALQWAEAWKQYGSWLYFRHIFFVFGFLFDMFIVTSMQLFLDSAAAKKRRKKILGDANLSSSANARGKTKWEIIMQEDVLAKLVDEYAPKAGMSFVAAILLRLPAYILDTEGLTYSMLLNLIITLRCLAVVSMFLGDELTMPVN